eukprot:gene7678-9141_t
MGSEELFGEGFTARSVEDLETSDTQEVRTCAKILKRLVSSKQQLDMVFPISGNKSHLAGTGNELLLTSDVIDNCFAHYTPQDKACYHNIASWQFLKTVTQNQFIQQLEEADKRGTKPGLFDTFSKEAVKGNEDEEDEDEDSEDEEEKGDEEGDEGDDEEEEMEINCAQPAVEDPETKYTTFASNNGWTVVYVVDEHGDNQPAVLTKSDKDCNQLVLWNYSANLMMKPELTVVKDNNDKININKV